MQTSKDDDIMSETPSKQTTVLLVEDDNTLSGVLKYNLSKEGYSVLSAVDGSQALDVARSGKPDIILLDIMIPKLDGLEVCRILRKESTVPIIMITAKSAEVDRVVGLELGADDYITKPFGIHELFARIKAMLRRCQMAKTNTSANPQSSNEIRSGNLLIDISRRTMTVDSKQHNMTPKEFDLLAFLVQNCGCVFKREQLLDKVWGYGYAGNTRTVDVHVSWIRHKIEANPQHPCRLITIKGVGYKFEESEK